MKDKIGSKRLTVVKETAEAITPKEAVAKVKARADTRRPRDTREPVEFDLTKATGSVLNQAVQQDVVRAVLGAFIEGRGLEGEWRLEITGARLVPVPAG